ncbi:MAG: N-formylglutamate amidohydrolase [Alphaproteobacteria bacterium]|nr:N-formylglutamate amidohydrolase [Alphaproteobacteria bacterium]
MIETLLGPGDPSPVEVINPGGRTPLLVICDHGGNAVPRRLGNLGLDQAALDQHIGWDIGAAAVARRLAAALDGPAVISRYSRLVIDCNRLPGHATSIAPVSDGVAVPGNRNLAPDEEEQRRREIFVPYHDAIARILDGGRITALVSIHSFTPVMADFVRPWQVGILWDDDPRLARPLLEAFRREGDLTVGDNQPYSAQGREGFSLHHHAADRDIPGALVEIRQDLITGGEGQAAWATRIGRIISNIRTQIA